SLPPHPFPTRRSSDLVRRPDLLLLQSALPAKVRSRPLPVSCKNRPGCRRSRISNRYSVLSTQYSALANHPRPRTLDHSPATTYQDRKSTRLNSSHVST